MRRRNWTIEEQASFLKKTGELLERGYPLSDAIHSMTYQMKKARRQEVLSFLADLKEGVPFYQILGRMGFHKTLIGYVYYAGHHGSLATAFQDGSSMMLKRNEDLERLKKIALYPLFLVAMTMVLFVFVERFLLPGYSSLYRTMDITPNFFMKLIYFAGDLFPFLILFLFLGSAFLAGFYLLIFRRFSPVRKRAFMASLPVINGFIRLITTHYFATQLGYLLSGGLPIFAALKMFSEHRQDSLDSQLGKEISSALIKGETLADIVGGYPFFAGDLPVIIRHGEENGKLHQELTFFGQHCLKLLEEKTEGLIRKIQPILYMVIGILVISMYLAILLPMFHMLDGI